MGPFAEVNANAAPDATILVGITLVKETYSSNEEKCWLALARCVQLVGRRVIRFFFSMATMLWQVLMQGSTADMATMAEDASASLLKKERCEDAGVEYFRTVRNYCGEHKVDNIWKPSQKALGGWFTAKLGDTGKSEIAGDILFRSKREFCN